MKRGVLAHLVQVDGNLDLLSLRHLAGATSLTDLQTVSGVLRLRNTYAGGPTFEQLTRVAAGLVLEDDGADPEQHDPPVLGNPSGLSLASLTVVNTGQPTLPFVTQTQIDAAGAISVHDNAFLCQSAVDDFVAAQQMAGWSGVATVSGNTGACTP